jgi:DDE superfamily endonuclease
VTERRTAKEYAQAIKWLVDEGYRDAEKILLIDDNLNTHCGASLYKTFPPEEARRILTKIEYYHTPKHGSWLNMAEIEISLFERLCLNRRISDKAILAEVAKKPSASNVKKRSRKPNLLDKPKRKRSKKPKLNANNVRNLSGLSLNCVINLEERVKNSVSLVGSVTLCGE